MKTIIITCLAIIITSLAYSYVTAFSHNNKPLKALSNSEFLKLADKHAQQILQVIPEWSTGFGVSEKMGGKDYQSRLSDYSTKSNKKLIQLNEQLLAEIKVIDKNKLTGTAKITYGVMENAYTISAQQNDYHLGLPSILGINSPYVINQLFAVHIMLPRLFINQQPLNNVKDIENYLKRLSQFKQVFNQALAVYTNDVAKGIVPPKYILQTVIDSSNQFIKPAIKENPIYTSFKDKIEKINNLTPSQKQKFEQKAFTLLEKNVYPAYKNYSKVISKSLSHADTKAGVWRLKNGAKIYQTALDAYGATGLNAQQIHEIGAQEVRRIHQQMDEILINNGYKKGSIAKRMKEIASDKQFLFSNDDKGREKIMDKLRHDIEQVMNIAPQWFATLPPQDIEVKRIPVYEQNSSASAYYLPPPLDGTRPGTYWINLKNTHDWPVYTLKTLTYHEGVPGHHFQASLQQDVKDMPLIRNMMFFSEYGEGWALYVEELAVEMGLYNNDAIGHLGRLRSEIYRAARLVVDTGLHYKQWSRKKAIDYMIFATGESKESITREIDRYIVWPGQATSYKLGMIKIKQLRKHAQQALGHKFDIRRFHDAILLPGSMPLPALEAHINEWIKKEKKQ